MLLGLHKTALSFWVLYLWDKQCGDILNAFSLNGDNDLTIIEVIFSNSPVFRKLKYMKSIAMWMSVKGIKQWEIEDYIICSLFPSSTAIFKSKQKYDVLGNITGWQCGMV